MPAQAGAFEAFPDPNAGKTSIPIGPKTVSNRDVHDRCQGKCSLRSTPDNRSRSSFGYRRPTSGNDCGRQAEIYLQLERATRLEPATLSLEG